MPVGEKVVEAILGLVRVRPARRLGQRDRARTSSPGVRARAPARPSCWRCAPARCSKGRFAPSIDDVVALAHPVLRHRMALNFSARAEGATIRQVIDGFAKRIFDANDPRPCGATTERREAPWRTRPTNLWIRTKRSDGIVRATKPRALPPRLPPLLVAAERLASGVWLGVHGRRKAGMGETFWQFRRYRVEDPSTAIDWRQSAKSQHLFVREREWEAAETVWFWRDGSPGMRYASRPQCAREMGARDRAGAGAGIAAGARRRAHRRAGREHAARRRGAIAHAPHGASAVPNCTPSDADLPPELRRSRATASWSGFAISFSRSTRSKPHMKALAYSGAHGYLVQIVDPAEEDFPFTGRARFEAHTRPRHARSSAAPKWCAASYRQRYDAHARSREGSWRAGWAGSSCAIAPTVRRGRH